jgi:hypothetical protein
MGFDAINKARESDKLLLMMIKDQNTNLSNPRSRRDCLRLIFKINKTARPINFKVKQHHHLLRFVLHLHPLHTHFNPEEFSSKFSFIFSTLH